MKVVKDWPESDEEGCGSAETDLRWHCESSRFVSTGSVPSVSQMKGVHEVSSMDL
jgi:hypothetical protein